MFFADLIIILGLVFLGSEIILNAGTWAVNKYRPGFRLTMTLEGGDHE